MKEIIKSTPKGLGDGVGGAGVGVWVVGLGGGIDSACTAALSQRALGEAVLGVLMPCHSDPRDAVYARMAAEIFDIETVTVDLGPVHDRFMRVLPPEQDSPHRDMASANIKARLRMTTLYYLAATRGYLVAGTGNKSEMIVGYFTKYGDGGVDLEPLGGLYKWQVRELARALGVPQPIIDRPPTAGLWPDQTDEAEMGLTYDQLDATLAAIEARETAGLDPAVLERVESMIAGSSHKRQLPPIWEDPLT